MKNSEIHEGMDQKEVRNFLSLQLATAYDAWSTPQPSMPSPSEMSTLDWAILSAKRARDLAGEQIKRLEQQKAVLILIEKMGWHEFDVSEMTTKDSAWWFSFIGTEDEYKQQFDIK